ncbi:MAG: hypothetical protein NTV39_01375 [Candidatus Saccharibacteria bacterium]|nr:hypothetical protein [Candidatus Saccharibacteria bacterium]
MLLWASVKGALTAKGTTSKVGNAPASWYNSGYSGGKFGRAAHAGISGNRTALIVTFKDGSKFVALRRCGNLAFPGKGKLPVVPTDNLARKIASQDPYAQGNAPVGGGQNATKGPGQYTKTPNKPGKTPRPNPTTPAPKPTGAATPDPQPTPTPDLPTPVATGTAPPPGM